MLEEGDDHLIDHLPLGIGECGQYGGPGLPFGRLVEKKDARRNVASVATGDANHTQSATAWRRGNSNDGIVRIQPRRRGPRRGGPDGRELGAGAAQAISGSEAMFAG